MNTRDRMEKYAIDELRDQMRDTIETRASAVTTPAYQIDIEQATRILDLVQLRYDCDELESLGPNIEQVNELVYCYNNTAEWEERVSALRGLARLVAGMSGEMALQERWLLTDLGWIC